MKKDKVLHFIFSFAIAACVGYLTEMPLLGLLAALLVGTVKEMADIWIRKAHGTEEAWMDLAADAAGAVAGTVVVIAMGIGGSNGG